MHPNGPMIGMEQSKYSLHNSLRPISIRTYVELQVAFLHKFFSAHRTSTFKRGISNFMAKDGEMG